MNSWLSARNILAIRLDNIGDVVMLGPSLRAVKEASPDARITLLASPAGATAGPMLPWVDDVIELRPFWQDIHGRIPFDPSREQTFISTIAARAFDAALIFTSFSQTPHVPAYLCYLAGIPLRAGTSKEFAGTTLTTQVHTSPDTVHQVERNVELVEAVGFPVRNRDLEVCVPHEARTAVPELLRRAGLDPKAPYFLLHPGASAAARRYSPERFGEIARLLLLQGRQVLITGVAREQDVVDVVAARASGAGVLLDGTTLVEYAALLESAVLVICGNTLPLHLADAVGTPVVGLYAGTDYEEQWMPRYTPCTLLRRPTTCYPCYALTCPIGQPCLDYDPLEVVAAAEDLLQRAPLMLEEAG